MLRLCNENDSHRRCSHHHHHHNQQHFHPVSMIRSIGSIVIFLSYIIAGKCHFTALIRVLTQTLHHEPCFQARQLLNQSFCTNLFKELNFNLINNVLTTYKFLISNIHYINKLRKSSHSRAILHFFA